MRYFPLFVDTQGLTLVLFGGGSCAEAKVRLLLKAESHLIVVSDELTPWLTDQKELGMIEHRDFESSELDWLTLRIAYDALEAPQEIARWRPWIQSQCQDHKVWLNVVDRRELCEFITPSIVDRDPVVVATTTSGTAPMLGRSVRAQVEAILPHYTGLLAQWTTQQRAHVHTIVPTGSKRRDLWAQIFDPQQPYGRSIAQALSEHDEALATSILMERVAQFQDQYAQVPPNPTHTTPHPPKALGEVYLVGAGPGNPELLTVRATQVLGRADVIVTDRLVSPLVIERYARREVEIIDVGKDPRKRSTPQAEIDQLLVDLANQHQVIVRLKGGDPMIFGRATSELETLKRHHIPHEVIPGVSAAIAGASLLKLPLTRRGVHRQCVFATGMSAEGAVDHPWIELAREGALLAMYMSARLSGKIQQRLISAGLDIETPVTVAASISTPRQQVYCGRLRELGAIAHALEPHPMILYIGAHPLGQDPTFTPQIHSLTQEIC